MHNRWCSLDAHAMHAIREVLHGTHTLLPPQLPVPPPQIVRMLERIHIYEVLPRKWVFVHTHDGVRTALASLDDGENGFSAELATIGTSRMDSGQSSTPTSQQATGGTTPTSQDSIESGDGVVHGQVWPVHADQQQAKEDRP